MPHWIECLDEHGHNYYYEEESGELSWEKPQDYHVEDQPEEIDEEMKKKMEKAMKGAAPKALDPGIQAKLNKVKQEQEEREKARAAAVEAGEEHWVEVYDPQSHAFYYHGTYSDKIQWEKPESYVMAADDELMNACIKIQCAYRGKVARRRMTAQAEARGVTWKPKPPPPPSGSKPPPPSTTTDKPPPPSTATDKPPPPSTATDKPPPPSTTTDKPPPPSASPSPPKPKPPVPAPPSSMPVAVGVKETYSFSIADTEHLKKTVADLKKENEKLKEQVNLKDQELKLKAHQLEGKAGMQEEQQSENEVLKLEIKEVQVQLEHEREEVQHLKDHLKEEEESFDKFHKHVEQQQEEAKKAIADRDAARKGEAAAEKESARLGAVNRRLEKQLAEKKPETCEVALSARRYEETDIIRLRDDLLAAKGKEVWMVEEERAKLCVQLDQVEEEVQRMQEDLVVKDMTLNKKNTEIGELHRSLKQLEAKVAKAKGQEKAMEVVSKQNASLLQLLQTQEITTEQEKKERLALQLELDELKGRHRRQMESAAVTEAEMLREKAEARAKAEQLSALHERSAREAKAMKAELEAQIHRQQLSVETMRDELTQRRGKQYEQLAKLNALEEALRQARDGEEGYKEQLGVLGEWKAEQDARLAEARAWREKADVEVGRVREEANVTISELSAKLQSSTHESLALKRQLREMKSTVMSMVEAHAESERDLGDAQRQLRERAVEKLELEAAAARALSEATEQAKARVHADMQRDVLMAQLQQLRSSTNDKLHGLKDMQSAVEGREKTLRQQYEQKRMQLAEQLLAKRHLLGRHLRHLLAMPPTSSAVTSLAVTGAAPAAPGGSNSRSSRGKSKSKSEGEEQARGFASSLHYEIDLRACGLRDDDIDVLASQLDQRQRELRNQRRVQELGSWQPVDLSGGGGGGSGGGGVGSGSSSAWQVHLLLGNNAISDGGAARLAAMLAEPGCCGVRSIDLRNNLLSMEGVRLLAEALESQKGKSHSHDSPAANDANSNSGDPPPAGSFSFGALDSAAGSGANKMRVDDVDTPNLQIQHVFVHQDGRIEALGLLPGAVLTEADAAGRTLFTDHASNSSTSRSSGNSNKSREFQLAEVSRVVQSVVVVDCRDNVDRRHKTKDGSMGVPVGVPYVYVPNSSSKDQKQTQKMSASKSKQRLRKDLMRSQSHPSNLAAAGVYGKSAALLNKAHKGTGSKLAKSPARTQQSTVTLPSIK